VSPFRAWVVGIALLGAGLVLRSAPFEVQEAEPETPEPTFAVEAELGLTDRAPTARA